MDNLMFPFGFSNAERLLVILRGNFYTHIQEYWTNVFHLWGYTDWGGGGKGRGVHFVSHALNMSIAFLIVGKG